MPDPIITSEIERIHGYNIEYVTTHLVCGLCEKTVGEFPSNESKDLYNNFGVCPKCQEN